MKALRYLDEVQHLRQVEALTPQPFGEALLDEVATMAHGTVGELGVQLDALLGVLGDIDGYAQKSMGIRLTHVLAATPLPPQLRTLLKSTVLSYQHDLVLLRGRVAASLARMGPALAAEVTASIMDAAERVIAARAELRDQVFAVAAQLARAQLPDVQRVSRTRQLAVADRQRWGQARVELEQLMAAPETLATGRFAERLARIVPPPDEPEPEPSLASLIEVE